VPFTLGFRYARNALQQNLYSMFAPNVPPYLPVAHFDPSLAGRTVPAEPICEQSLFDREKMAWIRHAAPGGVSTWDGEPADVDDEDRGPLEAVILVGRKELGPRGAERGMVSRVDRATVAYFSRSSRQRQGDIFSQRTPAEKIIVVLGQQVQEGKGFRKDAEVMKEYLVARGVPDSKVFVEEAHNTIEAALAARKLLRALRADSITLVCSELAMARSAEIFRVVIPDLPVVPCPDPYPIDPQERSKEQAREYYLTNNVALHLRKYSRQICEDAAVAGADMHLW
jgi:hypothetical protein